MFVFACAGKKSRTWTSGHPFSPKSQSYTSEEKKASLVRFPIMFSKTRISSLSFSFLLQRVSLRSDGTVYICMVQYIYIWQINASIPL